MTDDEIIARRAEVRLEVAELVAADLLRFVDQPGPKERTLIEAASVLAANTALTVDWFRQRGFCSHLEFGQVRTATFSLAQIQAALEATDAPVLDGIITKAADFCAAFEEQPAGNA